MSWQLIGFAFLAGATLYSAFRTVTSPVVAHAALYLAVAFTGIAGLFFLLEAQFLGVIQVLVYVGAVMTVTVFAIMLSDQPAITGEGQHAFSRQLVSPYWGVVPAVLALAMGGVILYVYGLGLPTENPQPQPGVAEVGQALFSTYVVPFEAASFLLLAAMVGAIIIISRQEAGTRR